LHQKDKKVAGMVQNSAEEKNTGPAETPPLPHFIHFRLSLSSADAEFRPIGMVAEACFSL
jgi:hypothetical protein